VEDPLQKRDRSRRGLAALAGVAAAAVLACALPTSAAFGAQAPAATTTAQAVVADAAGDTMEYQNPIVSGYAPDPSIVRAADGGYYLVNSSFSMDPGIPVKYSTDLVHWEVVSYAAAEVDLKPGFLTPSLGWGQDGLYAATIRENKGTYYMVVTNFSTFGVFITTSTDPKDPNGWSAPLNLTLPGQVNLDPDLLFDEDGSVWLTVSQVGSIATSKLDLTTGTIIGNRIPVWSGIDSEPEGPHLYRIGDYYFLSLAEGGTAKDHKQTIARLPVSFGLENSTPADWEVLPESDTLPSNPIIYNGDQGEITNTGHADFVQDENGNWWVVCLGTRPDVLPNLGRETHLAPMTWVDGWPIVNGGNPITVDMQGPSTGDSHEFSVTNRDDFAGTDLDLRWNHVYTPTEDVTSLTTRPGYLTALTTGATTPGGNTALGSTQRSALIGERQTTKEATFTTKLEFDPQNDGERAGVIIYGNGPGTSRGPGSGLTEFTVRRDAGENQIWLNKRQAAETPQTITAALGDADTVWLRVKSDDQRYIFSYSTNGTSWTVLDSAPSLSVIDFPGFAGVFNGIWATSGVTGVSTDTPAYFDWAEYLPYALDADAPVIVAATNPVSAGGVLTVTGTGFAPEESVAVSLATDPAVTTPVDTTVDGTFTVDVTVPAGTADGDYVVNALGAVSLVASTTPVTVQTPVATAVTLSSSATAPAVDTAFDLTADVDPTAAAGVVEFLDGETLAGSVAVADGTATLTTTAAVAGEHRYTARFVPADDAVFDPSVSNTVVVTVAGVPVTNPALTLSSDKVRAGGTVTITGTGYPVGEDVTIELHSAPVVLGSATVDAEGGFTVTTTIPATTVTGAHRIIATAAPSGARAEAALSVTGVTPSENGSLASTGAGGTGIMVSAVVALLFAGGLLLAVRHRRARRNSTV
jgi:alpha-N-arabinofuranosidase